VTEGYFESLGSERWQSSRNLWDMFDRVGSDSDEPVAKRRYSQATFIIQNPLGDKDAPIRFSSEAFGIYHLHIAPLQSKFCQSRRFSV
jgi:hypothetical protein